MLWLELRMPRKSVSKKLFYYEGLFATRYLLRIVLEPETRVVKSLAKRFTSLLSYSNPYRIIFTLIVVGLIAAAVTGIATILVNVPEHDKLYFRCSTLR